MSESCDTIPDEPLREGDVMTPEGPQLANGSTVPNGSPHGGGNVIPGEALRAGGGTIPSEPPHANDSAIPGGAPRAGGAVIPSEPSRANGSIIPDGPMLMSACLLGEPCRYDGAAKSCAAALELSGRRRVVPACPEQLGGLPTPRTASEIAPDGHVVDRAGTDRTAQFRRGAQRTLQLARAHGCTGAVLKANSPSCGVHRVYDGSFSGTLVAGRGVAAQLLIDAGLAVIDEHDLQRLANEGRLP